MYRRHVQGLPKPSGPIKNEMLLLTRADAVFAAMVLTRFDPLHYYHPTARFCGHEGYDGSVSKHDNPSWPHYRSKGKFIEVIDAAILRSICALRPIVDQADSCREEDVIFPPQPWNSEAGYSEVEALKETLRVTRQLVIEAALSGFADPQALEALYANNGAITKLVPVTSQEREDLITIVEKKT